MFVYANKVTRCDANFIDFPGVANPSANRRAKFEDGQLLKAFRRGLISQNSLHLLINRRVLRSRNDALAIRSLCNGLVNDRGLNDWPFLHYDEGKDVFCHTCVTGFRQGKIKSSKAE